MGGSSACLRGKPRARRSPADSRGCVWTRKKWLRWRITRREACLNGRPSNHSSARLPTLVEAPDRFEAALAELAALRERLGRMSTPTRELWRGWMFLFRAIKSSSAEASALVRRLSAITETSERIFQAMDFSFLFDNSRKLFAIGYRVTDGALDPNCYDLLASEARLASFVAIAKGDVLSAHWFHLSRALTPVGRGSALISWAGSMFEYLMPALVMKSPPAGLLSQTYKLRGATGKLNMAPSAACRGEFRNPRTTHAILISRINIRASACRDLA